MTKEEAEKKQEKSNKEAQEKWCPFINGKCRYSCVCYSEGVLTNQFGVLEPAKLSQWTEEKIAKRDESWGASMAGCTNALVTGEVYIDK